MRAIQYAAARLVQTAFEHLQLSNELAGDVGCLLQVSLNMMMRPHEAAVFLLGIQLHGERSL
jgi:hypothetical protein